MANTTFTPGTTITSSWLNDVNAMTYANIIGVGGVARSGLSKFQDTVSVLDFGAVMNNSGAGARTINTAALLSAMAINRTVYIPAGTLWINTIALTGFWHLMGAGATSTFIKGDGDVFTNAVADNGEMRLMEHMTILNDITKGKLFKNTVAVATNTVRFNHVNFGNSNYHIHSSGGDAVGWTETNCRFVAAAIESQHYEGLWVFNMQACYTWFSAIGIRCTNGNVSTCSIMGSTFEQLDSSAIVLDASNASFEVDGFHIYGTHFEVNGKLTNAADIDIKTTAVTRVRNITMNGVGFFSPTVTQTVRVSVTNTGGNCDLINIENSCLMGIVPLCTNTSAIKAKNIYFQTLSYPSTVQTPVQVASSLNGKYLGSESITGVSAGSSVVVATGSIIPSGTKTALISVQGNIYNGGATTHVGYIEARYFASGARIATTSDVNHSSGSNQGFVVTVVAGAIQVANKAAMSNNQSGDLTISYWG